MNIFLFSARAGQQVRAEKETVPRMFHIHTGTGKRKDFLTPPILISCNNSFPLYTGNIQNRFS